MRISVGADDPGPLPGAVIALLRERGHNVATYGPPASEPLSWVEAAVRVAEDVRDGAAEMGVVLCWTGTGASIAANKVRGVRAALCADAETARGARRWNHANVLALSMRLTSEAVAREILDAWLAAEEGNDPADLACLAALQQIDDADRTGPAVPTRRAR